MAMLGEKLEGGRRIDPNNGLIMPWYTSPCLEWLKTLDLKGKKIFEYGAGDSTHWFRSKGAIVYGVDTNLTWADKAKVKHEAYLVGYVAAVDKPAEWFDIVVIDGDYRDECTAKALMCLKTNGILIIDNYKQPSVPIDWTLTEKTIEGMHITTYKEPDHEDWQTAVITKP